MELALITNIVAPTSGQGRVNYELARAACHRGHRVFLLSRDVEDALARNENATWIRMAVENYPTRLLKDLAFAWQSTQWLREHRAHVDVALANGCNTWRATEFNAVHFVHSAWKESPVHTARKRNGPYAWYKWVYTTLNAFLEQKMLRKAGTIIAVSDQVREELVSIGLPADSVEVVHNGVDTDEFRPGPSDRRALGLPADVPLALFVGEIQTSRKNLDTVLRALDQVFSLHLAVVGRDEESPYPQMAHDLGVADRVHFMGYRSDVPDLMRAADLFVFPSRYEACSLVLLEAMASGLPIVTTQTAGGAELVHDRFGRTLSDPNDEHALANVLSELVHRPALRKDMASKARSAAQQHTWDKMCERYLRLFEEAASR